MRTTRASRTGSSVVTIIVVVWLLIGFAAAAQRNYFAGSAASCTKVGTTLVTIVAGFIFSWALFRYELLGQYNTFNHRALAAWIFCMAVMVPTALLSAPPPKEKTEGIIWNKSYLSLPPEEQNKYRGLKDWRVWWALFVAIVLAIYAFFLWYRFRHPW